MFYLYIFFIFPRRGALSGVYCKYVMGVYD